MDKKIKVSMITDNFYPTINGIVKVSDKLTEALKKEDGVEDITLVCPSGFKDMEFPYSVMPCRAIHLPFAGDGLAFVGLDKNFRKQIKNLDVDVYHAQTISSLYTYTRKIAKKKGKPLIVTVNTLYHNDVKMYCKFKLLSKLVTKIVTKRYDKADEVWTINEGVKDYLVSYGISADKIRVLSNGCDYKMRDDNEIEERKARLNTKYNIDEGVPVFCFVGRLFRYKNIFFILDSLLELNRRGVDFRMFYCGGGGTDKKKLISIIKKNGLDDKIFVLSKIPYDDLFDIYARADLQLFPSTYDSDGLVKYEASTCKTPTLLLKNSIASIGVEDGVSGFLSENDTVKYADRIQEIFADRELLDKVGADCGNHLIKTWEQIAKRAVDMYGETIKAYNEKNGIKVEK